MSSASGGQCRKPCRDCPSAPPTWVEEVLHPLGWNGRAGSAPSAAEASKSTEAVAAELLSVEGCSGRPKGWVKRFLSFYSGAPEAGAVVPHHLLRQF